MLQIPINNKARSCLEPSWMFFPPGGFRILAKEPGFTPQLMKSMVYSFRSKAECLSAGTLQQEYS